MFKKAICSMLALWAGIVAAGPKEDAAALLAKNPDAKLTVQTMSVQDPIQFTVELGAQKITFSSDAPSFVELVRAQVPRQTIQTGNYIYTLDWQKLVNNKKVIFDLGEDLPLYQFDPADFPSDSQPAGGYLDYHYKLLSVIGPLVSYQVKGSSYSPGAAHPNNSDAILVYDLSSSSDADSFAVANLLKWTDEADLVSALKEDTFLQKILKLSKRSALRRAQTVAQIAEVLDAPLQKKCLSFPFYEQALTSFSIYDYDQKNDLMNVRIQLSPSAHVCEANGSKELGLWVRPSPELKPYLVAAKKKGEGLFRNRSN